MHPPSHLPTPHLLVTARMGSNSQQSALTSVGIAIVIWFAITYTLSVFQWRARRRGLPFPPGPSSLLPVGNILHMRKSEPWRAHHALCKTYGRSVCISAGRLLINCTCSPGDTVYLPVLGQSIVILGGPQSLSDLLDKRSAVTSDRPQSPIIPL